MSFGTKEGVLEEGPPCLQHLCSKGFGEGSRNNALFNLGVYARMFDEDNWEQLVQRYNVDYLSPPLSHGEVGNTIRQLKKKDYFYKCEDHNGLTSQAQFQKECVSQINKFPVTVNQRAWQTRIQTLLDNLTIVEVPPDATFKGEFEDLLHAFASERAKGEEREDIQQGVAVWTDERVYFQVKDLKKHLSVNDFNHYTSNKITLRLQDLKAEKMFWRVRGKGIHVWSLPQEFFQVEDVDIKLPDLPISEEII